MVITALIKVVEQLLHNPDTDQTGILPRPTLVDQE